MTNKQKITDTSCPSCWENKNNIDEVLEEFDEIYPRIMKINHSIERRESIKNFLKQKLQQVEQDSLKNFVGKLRGDLMLHPDLENLNEIITKRLDKIIKN